MTNDERMLAWWWAKFEELKSRSSWWYPGPLFMASLAMQQRVSYKRVMYYQRKIAKHTLGKWMADRIDQMAFEHLTKDLPHEQ